jgi:hypothetical protein
MPHFRVVDISRRDACCPHLAGGEPHIPGVARGTIRGIAVFLGDFQHIAIYCVHLYTPQNETKY